LKYPIGIRDITWWHPINFRKYVLIGNIQPNALAEKEKRTTKEC
jgi:hypothetical protein